MATSEKDEQSSTPASPVGSGRSGAPTLIAPTLRVGPTAGFNWGAFVFGWFWGAFHRAWWTFSSLGVLAAWCLIQPMIGALPLPICPPLGESFLSVAVAVLFSAALIAIQFRCGFKGNEWAWNNRRGRPLEGYYEQLNQWNSAGIGFAIVGFLIMILLMALDVKYMNA